MIKNLGARKLGRTSAHRRSLMRNQATSLFLHEAITTTLAKAKELSTYAEKLITKAKPADMNAKRAVSAELTDVDVKKKLFTVLVPRYADRKGGYTRIYKLGARASDRAEMAIIKLVV
jgi:large subunit ribosomal protein L17